MPFRRLPAAPWLLVPIALLLLLTGCGGSEPMAPDDRPDIYLVSIDTLRWDYLAPYGYPEAEISPHVAQLADNGTLFEQAVASAGTTVPSHGTMLTGLYPRQHGARSNYHALYPETRPLPAALTEAGYATGAFISFQGMQVNGELGRGFTAGNAPYAKGAGPVQDGDVTLAEARTWLASVEAEQPVFMWLHFFEPHTPYEITPWASERLADYDGMLAGGVETTHMTLHRKKILGNPEDIEAMRTIYAGEVRRADDLVGEFLRELADAGRLDNSVVIFVADHGEAHAENGNFGHGATLWDTVIRVPLIVTDFRQPAQRRVDDRVGTIDIAPTIAELAGLDERFDWLGHSLLDDEAVAAEEPYFVEVELRTGRRAEDSWYDPNAVAIYLGDSKLTWRKDRRRFYRTRIDHHTPEPVVDPAEAAFGEYLAGLVEEFREVELDMTPGDVSEEQLRELQGLGYAQ